MQPHLYFQWMYFWNKCNSNKDKLPDVKRQMSSVKSKMSNVNKVKPFVRAYLRSFSGYLFKTFYRIVEQPIRIWFGINISLFSMNFVRQCNFKNLKIHQNRFIAHLSQRWPYLNILTSHIFQWIYDKSKKSQLCYSIFAHVFAHLSFYISICACVSGIWVIIPFLCICFFLYLIGTSICVFAYLYFSISLVNLRICIFVFLQPQSASPDVFLWLICGSKRVAYARIPARFIMINWRTNHLYFL